MPVATKIELKHLLNTTAKAEMWRDLLVTMECALGGGDKAMQALVESLSGFTAGVLKAESELYRELDLLADQLALAIPEYEIVLECNTQTRQDYILVERIDT